jgi:hypothetical protein
MLGTVAHLLDRAEAFCGERGIEEADLLGRRLAPDMLPLAFQFRSTVLHSLGAIEAVRRGVFHPDLSEPPTSLSPLKQRVGAARDAMFAIDPAEVEGWVGRDTRFEFKDRRTDYVAEDFLLSWAQPNFFFHVGMAFAILRAEGAVSGKRDWMGEIRRKLA